MEYPSRLFGIAPTAVDGEYGFGDVAYERTSFAVREEGKEWVGTAAALWGITAGVYLALMGPQGMRELGETMMARTRYAMDTAGGDPRRRASRSRRTHHVKEFVVDLDRDRPDGGRRLRGAPAGAASSSGRTSRGELPALGPGRARLRDRGPHAGRHRPARGRAGGGAPMSASPTPGTRPAADRGATPGPRASRSVPSRCPAASTRRAGTSRSSSSCRVPGRARRPAAGDGAGDHGARSATRPPRCRRASRRAAPPALPELSQVHVAPPLRPPLAGEPRRRPQRRRRAGHLHDEVLARRSTTSSRADAARGRPPPAPGPVAPSRAILEIMWRLERLLARDLGDGPRHAPARRRARPRSGPTSR